ncbi:MAG: hypothetical protein JWR34_3414 [Mycobacterium sp.]|nr:hypothetical protein [Mycobacterium sp.]
MKTTMTIRVAGSLDDPQLPAEAMSLLLGVSVDEIRAHGRENGTGVTAMPHRWMRAGRQRAFEAQAHTGCTDMVSGLRYWAKKDHGAHLEIDYVDLPGGGAE